MPQKNVVKEYHSDCFYHVYNRAAGKYPVFDERENITILLMLFDRYLGKQKYYDRHGLQYPKLNEYVEIGAFCIMPTHFHLLLRNKTPDGITNFMHRTLTALALISNQRHNRRGVMFESTFKASEIIGDAYYQHIIRYIHLNPLDVRRDYQNYPYSSHIDYTNRKRFSWLKHKYLKKTFEDTKDYIQFMADGVENHKMRKTN